MNDNILYETRYWKVILADNQYEIGRCVIDIKRDIGTLSELTAEEWKDLRENIIVKLENTIKKVFGAEMFNWSCLMNNYFKPHVKKPHPHVHFHIRPRYRNPVKFMGETFIDKKFGHHYNNHSNKIISQEIFDGIKNKLIEEIG